MSVTITLRGRHYTVRSDEDTNDVVAVAQWLDDKLSDMAARTRGADGETVALLVALNVASDFQRFRKELLRDLEDTDRALHAAGALLDASSTSEAPAASAQETQEAVAPVETTTSEPVAAVDPDVEDPTDLPLAAGLQVSED